MNLIKDYTKQRAAGYPASHALSNAKTRARFEEWEDSGLVKLEWEPDYDCSYEDLAGDTFNRKANPDIPESRMAREEKAFRDSIEREGVWGLVGYVNKGTEDRPVWEPAGSVWGFVGMDGHGYEYDIMAETIEAAEKFLAGQPSGYVA